VNQIDTISVATRPAATSSTAAECVTDAYAAVRFNAMKHGILSRLVVLTHENGVDASAGEAHALRNASGSQVRTHFGDADQAQTASRRTIGDEIKMNSHDQKRPENLDVNVT
jgi:hypothetical protein